MAQGELQDLARRRLRVARTFSWAARVFLGAVMLMAVAGFLIPSQDGDFPLRMVPLLAGMMLIALGSVILTRGRVADALVNDRYNGGPLVVRRSPRRLLEDLSGYLVLAIGYGVSGLVVMADQPLTDAAPFGLLFGFTVLISLWFAGKAALRLVRPSPLLAVTEEGMFAPDIMREMVPWKDVQSLPVAPGGTLLLLVLRAVNARANARSFLSRAIGHKDAYPIAGRAADATQADVMAAVAHYRPDLSGGPVALPPGVSFTSTF